MPQPPHGKGQALACKERRLKFTPPPQRAGEISEVRPQLYVAFVSFVLGAAGALHSLMIEALCNDPAWFDDFIALSSSNAPHIAHKRMRV